MAKTKTINSFFDIANCLFEKHYPSIEDINKYTNIWMLNMLLSCDAQLAEIAHEMSKVNISNKEYFDCLYYGLPKGKRYIQYNAQKVKNEENVKYISKYFKCNYDIARQYMSLMDEKEIKHIIEIYTVQGIRK